MQNKENSKVYIESEKIPILYLKDNKQSFNYPYHHRNCSYCNKNSTCPYCNKYNNSHHCENPYAIYYNNHYISTFCLLIFIFLIVFLIIFLR